MSEHGDVTVLIAALSGGDRTALDRLLPRVYDELRHLAHRELRRERAGHTLTTTDLVHELYLKLARVERLTWKDRAHFFAVCAQAMRRILVNYALMKKAAKRGGGGRDLHVPFDEVITVAETRPEDLLSVHEVLGRLETLSPRQTRVVECRVFGGMGVRDTAAALGISPATVKRDWALARAWLRREMETLA
jgi:RNA polymerase sigma factor (TIGR02999 family)